MKWQPIFTNPLLRSQDWVLPSMILGAVFLHGMAFYLIQASTAPDTAKKTATTSRVSVLNPQNPRDQAALAWIENRDPAAMANQAESSPPPRIFAGQAYQPSYEQVLPQPLPIAKEDEDRSYETFFPAGPVPLVNTSKITKTSENPVFYLTKILPSSSVNLENPAPFIPPKNSDKVLTPARFLIVKSDTLVEKTLFLLQSSGNDALDNYARNWLATADISLKDNQTSGWVQMDWGSEIWNIATP